MERSRAKVFFTGRAGTTLVELMVAVAIMAIGLLGLFGAFTYISKSLFVSRAQTLATNLGQEKIEVLKNATYYDLLITTAANTDARFSPGILYDTANYPPETIVISNISYTRYTYVTMVDVSGGNIIAVGSNYPDTGLKEITVNIVWVSNGSPKKWTLTNLLENPAVSPLDSTVSGTITIKGSGAALAGASVKVEQNNAWSASTDVNGNYSFQVNHGTYTVRASSAGYYDEVSPNFLVARGNTANPTINPLEKISTGSVSGIAWYNNDLVISQVVASTHTQVGDLSMQDVEYVELFNPTTMTFVIGYTSNTYQQKPTTLVFEPYACTATTCRYDLPKAEFSGSFTFDMVNVTHSVGPGQYYLYANAPSFYINGVLITADSYYDSGLTYPHYINNADAGGLGIFHTVGFTNVYADMVGWGDSALPFHVPYLYNGTYIPTSGGMNSATSKQLVRVSSPVVSAAGIMTYGDAYNSQSNANDFLYESAGLTTYVFPPHTTASGTFPIISGRVPYNAVGPIGVVVSASDMNSASQTFYATTITSGALHLPYVPFTLTGVTTGTYSVALDFTNTGPLDYTQVISNVTINQGAATAIPNASTTPSWAAANLYSVQLSSSMDTGFVKGTVTDINNVPIPNIPVTGGGDTKLTAANGQYFMNVSSGSISLTANATNGAGSNSTYVQSVLPVTVSAGAAATQNFVLSQGARLTGYCTAGGATPVPNQVVNALLGGNQMGTATSDGTGVFTINNISTGTYVITPVIGTGQSSTPASDLFPVSAPSITATVNTAATVFVGTFTISGAYGTITGTITDTNSYMVPPGKVTSGALIIASTNTISASPPAVVASSAAAQVPVYMTSSKADGSYSLPVRGGATYNVRVFVPVDNTSGGITVDTKNTASVVVGVGAAVTTNVTIP